MEILASHRLAKSKKEANGPKVVEFRVGE